MGQTKFDEFDKQLHFLGISNSNSSKANIVTGK